MHASDASSLYMNISCYTVQLQEEELNAITVSKVCLKTFPLDTAVECFKLDLIY